jgi:hypothetical protein
LAVVEEVCDASGEEEEDSEDEMEDDRPSATRWEEMHDIYFQKPILFTRGVNSSVESLMEDEEDCALNLSKMYNDENSERRLMPIEIEVDESVENKKQIDDVDNTLDVIDDLLKSFEKEVDMGLEAVPIVNVENE